jgi:hypothetical protein
MRRNAATPLRTTMALQSVPDLLRHDLFSSIQEMYPFIA